MKKTNLNHSKSAVLNDQPLVSVILPVYNAGRFLTKAIRSIKDQSYKNWELIIVDDRSTDSSWQIIKREAKGDRRIRIFRNNKNLGAALTATFAISFVRGEYMARMDADDIALPERFAKQVAYLNQNPNTVVVGSQCHIIDAHDNITGEKVFPTDSADIYKQAMYFMPNLQPTLMFNLRALPDDFVFYDNNWHTAEEVTLLFRLFQHGQVANLPEKLLLYRLHDTNTSLKSPKKTFFNTFRGRMMAIFKLNYKPRVLPILVNLAQFGVITLIPNGLIWPLYTKLRGYKKDNFNVEEVVVNSVST